MGICGCVAHETKNELFFLFFYSVIRKNMKYVILVFFFSPSSKLRLQTE